VSFLFAIKILPIFSDYANLTCYHAVVKPFIVKICLIVYNQVVKESYKISVGKSRFLDFNR